MSGRAFPTGRQTDWASSEANNQRKKDEKLNQCQCTTQSLWTASAPEFPRWWRRVFNGEGKMRIRREKFLSHLLCFDGIFSFFLSLFFFFFVCHYSVLLYFLNSPNRSKSKSKSNSNALLRQQKKELLFRGTNSFRQVSPTDPSWEQMHCIECVHNCSM